MQRSWALGPLPDCQDPVICTGFSSSLPSRRHWIQVSLRMPLLWQLCIRTLDTPQYVPRMKRLEAVILLVWKRKDWRAVLEFITVRCQIWHFIRKIRILNRNSGSVKSSEGVGCPHYWHATGWGRKDTSHTAKCLNTIPPFKNYLQFAS